MSNSNKDLCRTCFGQNRSLESIFQIVEASDTNISLAEIINASISSSVHITRNDGCSDRICSDCSQKVLEFHKFKLDIEKNELILKTRIRTESSKLASSSVLKEPFLIERSVDLNDIKIEVELLIKEQPYEKETHEKDNIGPTLESHQFTENDIMLKENTFEQGIKEEENSTEEGFKEEIHWTTEQQLLHHEMTIYEEEDNKIPTFEGEMMQEEFNFDESVYQGSGCEWEMPYETVHISHETQLNQIEEHYIRRIGKKSSECKICHKTIFRKNNLKRHLLTHKGDAKPFECEHCHRICTTKGNLQNHLLTHSGIKAFQCEVCNKKFTQKNGLTKHLLIHTGEKSFECELCHKKFTQKSNLKTHLLTHWGKKSFECYLCNRKFIQKVTLKKHLQSIHP